VIPSKLGAGNSAKRSAGCGAALADHLDSAKQAVEMLVVHRLISLSPAKREEKLQRPAVLHETFGEIAVAVDMGG